MITTPATDVSGISTTYDTGDIRIPCLSGKNI